MSVDGDYIIPVGASEYKIKLSGIDKLSKDARSLEESVRGRALRGAMRAAMNVFRTGLIQRLPSSRTGNLRRSIRMKIKFLAEDRIYGRLSVGAGNTAFYAYFLEAGTGVYGPRGKAYEIKPKLKKALKWGGAKHPFERTRMQGIRPRFYTAITARNEMLNAEHAFEEEFYRQIGQPFGP